MISACSDVVNCHYGDGLLYRRQVINLLSPKRIKERFQLVQINSLLDMIKTFLIVRIVICFHIDMSDDRSISIGTFVYTLMASWYLDVI